MKRSPHTPGILLAVIACLGSAQAAAKRPICGLVAMGSLEFVRAQTDPGDPLAEIGAHQGVYAAAVIAVTWRQLQPRAGAFDPSAIDRALDAVGRYNAANRGHPVSGKLRVFAGTNAPDWAKSLGGPPVRSEFRGESIAIGRFWQPTYRAAWADLQRLLAARYDADPRIAEVAITSCSTHSAEPFHARVTPPSALAALRAAGYGDAAERACIMGALDDYAVWQTTPLDFTFSNFLATDSGRPRIDADFPVQVMQAFRARYGARAVLATHGLDADVPAGKQRLYDEMRRLGPPIAFQTVSPRVDFAEAVRTGFGHGASEIELWDSQDAGGQARISPQALSGWSHEFTCAR